MVLSDNPSFCTPACLMDDQVCVRVNQKTKYQIQVAIFSCIITIILISLDPRLELLGNRVVSLQQLMLLTQVQENFFTTIP